MRDNIAAIFAGFTGLIAAVGAAVAAFRNRAADEARTTRAQYRVTRRHRDALLRWAAEATRDAATAGLTLDAIPEEPEDQP